MTKMICAVFIVIALAYSAPAADPVTGRDWAREWSSESSGHHGPLHARISKTSNGDYRVTFRGRFWVVFPFRYSTTLIPTGTGPNGEVYLTGQKRLGFGLGTFSTSAVATSNLFVAEFTSKRDSGRFTLRR
ncbi:MAG TPA: hypothetical protein VGJ05_02360 [Fimbriiglobus sp.]|jgi:hypothetical protein